MTAQDIEDGKASFQRADLIGLRQHLRHGLLISGRNYTAEYLLRLSQVTQENIAQARFGKPFAARTVALVFIDPPLALRRARRCAALPRDRVQIRRHEWHRSDLARFASIGDWQRYIRR
jgi:hypothetical protein